MPDRKKIFAFSFVSALPFIVLALTFAAKLYFYTREGTDYWLDEIIVTAISRQPLRLLFDTVTAEPHPPGFYLFLRLLPVSNMFATRLILMVLCYGLTAVVLVFGYLKGIIQRFRLQYGLSLFFATYSFLEISAHVRPEILSFPLMLFVLLLTAHLWDKASISKFAWLALSLSLTALLGIGYIYYFFCAAIVMALYLHRRHPALLLAGLIQTLCAAAYFFLFGRHQLAHNLGRFSWFGNYSNSLFDSLRVSLTGRGTGDLLPDMVLLLFLYLILSSIPNLRSKNPLALPALFAVAALAIISFPLYLNVRTRYSALLVLLACMLTGWRILDFRRPLLLLVPLTAIIMYSGLVSFKESNVGLSRIPFGRLLVEKARGQTFGYIEDSATLQFAIKITYIPEENIVPVNVRFPSLSRPPFSINKTLLSVEGKAPPLSEREVKNNLARLGISNYFYMSEFLERGNYIDDDRLLMRVLDKYCRQRESRKDSGRFILFTYRQCEFRQRFPYE